MTEPTRANPPYSDPVKWTRQERYWIGKLISETGEFNQAAGNAMCFGIDTPDKTTSGRGAMQDEAGDIIAALRIAIRAGIFSLTDILRRADAKEAKLLDAGQRDNLGRRLAPPVPEKTPTPPLLTPDTRSEEPERTAAAPEPAFALSTPWELSPPVLAHLQRLSQARQTSPDTILRRLLKIEDAVTIPQDGTIGYRDPATELILPQGFAIERTLGGVTYRATAADGGFRAENGDWFENLNRLNVSLPIHRAENAWDHWRFIDQNGQRRKLNSARPATAPRKRKFARATVPVDAAGPHPSKGKTAR